MDRGTNILIKSRIIWLVILLNLALCGQYCFSMSYSFRTIPIENGADRSDIIWNSVATIYLDSVLNSDSLTFFLDNEVINVHVSYCSAADIWNYIHYSSSDSNSNVYLSILDDYVSGNIIAGSGNYSIQSLSPNQVIISKRINEENIDDDSEPLFDLNYFDNEGSENFAIVNLNDTPIIRVLFLYTDSVWDSISHTYGSAPTNIKLINLALFVINQANESFVNSEINAKFELAYIVSCPEIC